MGDSPNVILLMSGGVGLEPKSFISVLSSFCNVTLSPKEMGLFVHACMHPSTHPSSQKYSLRSYYIPDTVCNAQSVREDSEWMNNYSKVWWGWGISTGMLEKRRRDTWSGAVSGKASWRKWHKHWFLKMNQELAEGAPYWAGQLFSVIRA